MMRRGAQISLILAVMWLGVVLLSGPLGDPPWGWERECFVAVKLPVVSPRVGPAREIVASLSQAEPGRQDIKLTKPQETRSSAIKKDGGTSIRAPIQVATLVKQKNLDEVIKKYAQEYGVDEDLIWAVIRQESGFNPGAVSPKGAMGLMQLMPGTAALMGVSKPFDVDQNIAGGVKYLEQCLSQFNQDVPMALAAYNAGPANVLKYQGCPPFAETRNYVASILQAYAGEPIRADLKLCRVNYIIQEEEEDPSTPFRLRGLPWRIPLPNWKIATPQSKLGSPHWKVALRPF